MAIKDDNLTRKERRDEARAQRLAQEQAAAAAAARRRRFGILGGLLALAAVLIAVIAATSGGGSSPAGKLKAGAPVPGASAAMALFQGIPEQGNTLGSPQAPITLAEYVDLQCPVCRSYALQTFPSLVSQYVKPGKVKVEFHSLPVIQGPDGTTSQSQDAARYALAAGQQNLLWPFTELVYENQQQEGTGYLTIPYLEQLAGGITGLNAKQAVAAANSTPVNNEITTDNAFATARGATATPSFFLARTGQPLKFLSSGALAITDFAAAFKKLGV